MEKEKQYIDKKFANRISKELRKVIRETISKQLNDKLEKDFLKRKEENDKYFFS